MAVKAIKKWTPYRDWEQLDVVLTVEQVCAVLRISRPTCVKLLQSGALPGAKIAGQWRIDRDALRDCLREGGDAQRAAAPAV